MPGTCAFTARMLSRAAALRRVISMAAMPPRCSACARRTVPSTLAAVTTGSTLHFLRMFSNTRQDSTTKGYTRTPYYNAPV